MTIPRSKFRTDAKRVSEQFLRDNYPQKGKQFCADALGWPESKVRTTASKLGLKMDKSSEFFKEWQRRAAATKVGKKRPNQAAVMSKLHSEGKMARSAESIARTVKKLGEFVRQKHPRGMLGKKHSSEARKVFSEKSAKRWSDPNYTLNSEAHRQRKSDLMLHRTKTDMRLKIGGYSRGKQGRRPDLENRYFRSAWEANYARYLNWMISRKEIHKWDYEVDTFWFEKIRRGVRSYTPDFKIWETADSSPHYVEVKGWMDAKSATKIKRMRIYHPAIKLTVFGSTDYKKLKQLSGVLPGWEL